MIPQEAIQDMQNTAIDRMAREVREEKVKLVTDLDGDVNKAINDFGDRPLIVFNATLEAVARKILKSKIPL